MPFILDSGAFSVWNRGLSIDLDRYIQFCLDHPACSYYVNLDIIPGKPGDVKSKTPDAIEAACQGGWDNYQYMLRRLPLDKVVPVFHQGDTYDWLEKYLDFGTPYIGISPANDRTTEQKMKWLGEVRKYIFDSAGKPIVRTHGFAVTSFRLMNFMQWHSVDSASWVRSAAYGTVYLPFPRGQGWRYDVKPFLLSVSPKSPAVDDRGKHITTLSPTIKAQVFRYLEEIKMPVGEFTVEPIQPGHKKQDDELWYEKNKSVVKITKMGIATCLQRRYYVNKIFLEQAEKVIPVDHIYFAGAGGAVRKELEIKLSNRLMSFHEIETSNPARLAFLSHLERLST